MADLSISHISATSSVSSVFSFRARPVRRVSPRPPPHHQHSRRHHRQTTMSAVIVISSESSSSSSSSIKAEGPIKRRRESNQKKKKKKRYALDTKEIPRQLDRERRALFAFWCDMHVLARGGQSPLDPSTMHKRWERIRCLLGYLHDECGMALKDMTLASVCTDGQRIEGYMEFLAHDRSLRASTRAEHLTAIVTVLKYLATKGHAVAALQRKVMDMRNVLLRYRDPERSGTWQELRENGKWLHWDQVLKVAQALRDEVDDMLATGCLPIRGKKSGKRKRHVGDVRMAETYRAMLVLDFYTLMPPGRALEYRAMRLGDDLVRRKDAHNKEQWWLTTSKYKNRRFRGKDDTDLSLVPMLVQHLEEYLEDHRPVLLGRGAESDEGYVFLTVNGEPYSSGAWSMMLKRMFQRLGNQKVSVNMLRLAFVTHDRRTAADRKKAALVYAYSLANASV
eukprot:TRINITY_DN467_c0_g1_i2.p1 TRINITY_DN467_c0_g1~~TRINITY_DN467_c0_g1_i2.p1  ORF type:complete len:451 (+),score=29.88 TRINITY_DN467_c0_g1_i2:1719-3071(+)